MIGGNWEVGDPIGGKVRRRERIEEVRGVGGEVEIVEGEVKVVNVSAAGEERVGEDGGVEGWDREGIGVGGGAVGGWVNHC